MKPAQAGALTTPLPESCEIRSSSFDQVVQEIRLRRKNARFARFHLP